MMIEVSEPLRYIRTYESDLFTLFVDVLQHPAEGPR